MENNKELEGYKIENQRINVEELTINAVNQGKITMAQAVNVLRSFPDYIQYDLLQDYYYTGKSRYDIEDGE